MNICLLDTIQSDLHCILIGEINTFVADVPILENLKSPQSDAKALN
jgi:hypothetical protein